VLKSGQRLPKRSKAFVKERLAPTSTRARLSSSPICRRLRLQIQRFNCASARLPADERGVQFIEIDWAGRQIQIEYQWIAPTARTQR